MHTLIWFHRDMRVHDHQGLKWALEHSKKISAIVYAPQNASNNKLHFWRNLAEEMKLNLERLGIELLVQEDETKSLPLTATNMQAHLILTHQRISFREKSELLQLQKNCDIEMKEMGELTLYPSEKLSALSLNDLKPFTKFKKFAEANWVVPAEIEITAKEYTSALKRLQHYIHETEAVNHYHETRNGLLEVNDSSKFSPWLSWGALSPRRVYWELKKLEAEKGKSAGIDALIYELIWRDYFKFLSGVQGESFFERDGMRTSPFVYQEDADLFTSWCRGETGDDFVDANMRELLLTGWMSNRGRQNVASFLAKTLKLDWTLGAKWFEDQLIDEDPENNFGNWQYIAGVGTDPRDRIFDVKRQAALYDPHGEYQKRWLRS